MAIIDIKLPKSIARALNIPISDARSQQLKVLKKLLRKARFTEFGQRYRFDETPTTYVSPARTFSNVNNPNEPVVPFGVRRASR